MQRDILKKDIRVEKGHIVIETNMEDRMNKIDIHNEIGNITRQMLDLESQMDAIKNRYSELKQSKAFYQEALSGLETGLPELE